MLQVQNIEKYYGSRNNVTKALDRVSFDVADGEFMAVMGASGSGKTTLLNCISTIDTVSAGNIFLDGENIAELPAGELARFRRERLGFVFQDFNLLDTLTIEENIGLALSLNYRDADKVQRQGSLVSRIFWKSFPIRYRGDKSSVRHAQELWWPDSRLYWPTSPQAHWIRRHPKIFWKL